jgi:enoyl-CoA hydratase/carnithine racemase
MNAAMVAELSDFLQRVERDDQVRVVVLTGAGEGVFIAHYDVGEIAAAGSTGAASVPTSPIRSGAGEVRLHGMHRALLAIENLPKPVIAAINGRAHGGGYETALACDFRLMARGGSVGLPEVRIGIIPGGGGTQRLPRLIGRGRAMDIILRGRVVDAETALSYGMVDRVVEAEKLLDETMALARELAALPAVSLAAVKQVFREAFHLPLVEALGVEQKAFFEALGSEETRKILQRYRTPNR